MSLANPEQDASEGFRAAAIDGQPVDVMPPVHTDPANTTPAPVTPQESIPAIVRNDREGVYAAHFPRAA